MAWTASRSAIAKSCFAPSPPSDASLNSSYVTESRMTQLCTRATQYGANVGAGVGLALGS